MVVPVPGVRGVAVSVVHVVEVVAVRDRHVAAVLAMGVAVAGVLDVGGLFALVHMAFVDPVQVAVMHEVDVVAMRNGNMAAAFTMVVAVFCVGMVFSRCAHDDSLPKPDLRSIRR
ncbi:hypothetical protein P3T39_006976 [Kitasatospora sp. GP82]|nr:hypothetical protein [Kitasatospora sp. GP82]